MMAILDLGLHRRVKVWRDSAALPVIGAADTREQVIATTTRSPGPAGLIAVEAVLPRGPMVMYGALGGTFAPDASTASLTVRVHHLAAEQSGPPFESELVVQPELTLLGLPSELVDAVLRGVNEQLIIGPDPGPGHLTFDRAAHGSIGSNEEMFRMLARAVVRLMTEPPDAPDEDIASVLLEVLA
jgi:hypothetical protein